MFHTSPPFLPSLVPTLYVCMYMYVCTSMNRPNQLTQPSPSQNHILQSLIKATAPSTPNTPPPFRFTVNSTIVQQGLVDKSTTSGDAGKRGMHSASGAFWDVNRDGMWTFKYPGGEQRGLDVVVSVTWFAMA